MPIIKSATVLRDLEGVALKDNRDQIVLLGKTIAGSLVGQKTKPSADPMKDYILATKLYTDKDVEVDQSEFELIKAAIKETPSFTDVVKGQILLLLSQDNKDKV